MLTYALSRFRLGFSRSFLLLISLACAGTLPTTACKADLISLQGSGELLPNTPGQQITLLLSGSDFYSDGDLQFKINGGVGPAPRVTHVFGDTGSAISPASLFDGSIWQGGDGGIGLGAEGTYPGASGLNVFGSFYTPAFEHRNAPGVYAELTVTTVGISGGSYTVDLTGTKLRLSDVDAGTFVPVGLQFSPITLTVVPEPSAYALAAIGAVALLSARRRKAVA